MSTRESRVIVLGMVLSLALSACSPGAALAPAVLAADGSSEGGPAGPARGASPESSAAGTVPESPGEVQIVTGGVVDTGQHRCYGNEQEIPCPQPGESFYGQDGQYTGAQPSYVDNGNGTVTDLNTGLMWQKTPGDKVTWTEGVAGAETFDLAGYDDWRLPTIKELYSLIDFSGSTGMSAETSVPYIDTDYFDFEYGDTGAGERFIDAQYWSSTEYVGTTMDGDATAFGVNFADGRIKGYPKEMPNGEAKTAFVRYVRGNPDYGVNRFVDNGDPSAADGTSGSGQAGTITDLATGLMWMQADSGTPMNWEEALHYAENLEYAGYDDWRLPNAKELQSIVDYTRAPDATDPAQRGAAIDPVFDITSDDSYFWTSTTHLDGSRYWAVYITFGEAWGYMEQPPGSGNTVLLNVHGAGAQRSDPKSGDPADWPTGNGPQGDVVRIYNYVRCVRDVGTAPAPDMPHTVYLPRVMGSPVVPPTPRLPA